MISFSERLREARKVMGLSQVEFAELAGVTPASQVNYEKGTRKPDTSYLEAIAAHGVDVGYLLTAKRTPVDALSPDAQALLDSYQAADEAGRAALEAVAVIAKRKPNALIGGGARKGNAVSIGGDVGQQVNGDQTVTAPMTFNVGKGRK